MLEVFFFCIIYNFKVNLWKIYVRISRSKKGWILLIVTKYVKLLKIRKNLGKRSIRNCKVLYFARSFCSLCLFFLDTKKEKRQLNCRNTGDAKGYSLWFTIITIRFLILHHDQIFQAAIFNSFPLWRFL